MRTVAIACRTLEDEINAVVKTLPGCCPIRWIESGLHNYPSRLRERIQREIDIIDEVENILLLFGYCGKSIEGLRAPRCRLVVPKVDDCISLLLGGDQVRLDLGCQFKCYYLTGGWLRYENNIFHEYRHSVEKFGPAKALRIFRVMLANYSSLCFIDTGTYDLDRVMAKTAEFAAGLNLAQKVVPGTLRLIVKAFSEEWDEDFLKVPPNVPLQLNYCAASPPPP